MKKSLIYKPLFSLFFIALASQVAFAQEKTKSIQKEYELDKDADVYISNKYGKVQIDTWSQNKAILNVEIKAEGRNESRTREMLERIKIDIDNDTPGSLSVVTQINSMSSRGKEHFAINYYLKIPKTVSLRLKNSFGPTSLDNFDGPLEADLRYCDSFRAQNLTGKSEIELQFSKARIESMAKGRLEPKYTETRLAKARDIELDSRFSEVKIGEVESLDLDIQYGELDVDKAERVSGKFSFTPVQIKNLKEYAKLSGRYGGDFEIKYVAPDFESVTVETQFTDVEVGIDKRAKAEVEADLSFADFDYPNESWVDFHYREKGNTSSKYRGKIGGGGTSKVKFKSSYGDVELEEAELDD
ncbi:hypothetical protein FUAX_28220 [Fulvitalea axinellae]|uniref:Adhesin domain-containing protein n=1 Tax=Fulvitalea axinellae TaxID=1182444 RepID=A0AAU9DH44_9BACT|nr:hypothetical protein FUAX_28220 [Fulvitalea axinellae]